MIDISNDLHNFSIIVVRINQNKTKTIEGLIFREGIEMT